ncbi:6-phosphogluconolactonase [Solicola sp. PLA-1-18]|uniref:6-phosphogluconolactonase n=1 Tax=Solicola sp. PLA-1-18 TaxID=3380532 RepID=UPI003B7C44E5
MSEPTTVVSTDKDALAAEVSRRLVDLVEDVQAAGGIPSVVLTGGTIADVLHRRVAQDSASTGVAWADVDLWWGDERWLRMGDPERNEQQARDAFLDAVGADGRVRAVAYDDGVITVEQAADAYAAELAAASDDGVSPVFDVVMLGVGDDGHVASLFPHHPGLDVTGVAVTAVFDSPKPPPTRVSMTFETLNKARHVWFLVSGEGKAAAVARALAGDDVAGTPANGVRGTESTTWFLDPGSASQL